MSTETRYRHYRIRSELPEREMQALVDDCLNGSLRVVKEIKNNQHNFVAVVSDGTPEGLIVKVPRKRNRRLWERVLTFFRDGESFRVFESHQLLRELGFFCPEAVLAAERRRFGVVVDSFIMYRYLPGEPASREDAEDVSSELMALHGKGYTRGDPKSINFLISGGRVAFIDFRLSRPRLFRKHNVRMEYAHLLHTLPEAIHYLPEEERNALGFRFATWLRRAISDMRSKKRDIREAVERHSRHLKLFLLLLGVLMIGLLGVSSWLAG
ncbi:hypothetical protein K8B33_14440 [Alcanivorax sp. JB21]|uniref:lipopolysaccharide core heptose(II) kinase RfaY n=1 Tax=Alcanivorax limicola TaxID=2874102 RepID=UPI001CBBC434|nr:lipopolysaccharide core heptose(II) kinase RfaY [Alcanivorax limicola]MBZ2190305.1 hypothetical protein [Alcanivorax limicola]